MHFDSVVRLVPVVIAACFLFSFLSVFLLFSRWIYGSTASHIPLTALGPDYTQEREAWHVILTSIGVVSFLSFCPGLCLAFPLSDFLLFYGSDTVCDQRAENRTCIEGKRTAACNS